MGVGGFDSPESAPPPPVGIHPLSRNFVATPLHVTMISSQHSFYLSPLLRRKEIEAKFINKGFVKTPIEPRKPGTKFREAEAEAEAGRKNYYEAEAEAESTKNSI